MKPTDIGAPPKFTYWRENQLEAIQKIVRSEKRFRVLNQPTGSGKSLVYYLATKILGGRTVILNSTKALQDQLCHDYPLTDMRGQNAYQCNTLGVNCDCGPCHFGFSCPIKSTCPYHVAYRNALNSDAVVTNYAYWLSMNIHGKGLGKVDNLVLDEAHTAPEHICNQMSITINKRDLEAKPGSNVKAWAMYEYRRHKDIVSSIKSDQLSHSGGEGLSKDLVMSLKKHEQICKGLETIIHSDESWVFDDSGGKIQCTPVWASSYRDVLFQNVKNVILTSSTITPKIMEYLGIPDYDFFSFPHTFPPKRREVVLLPVARVDFRTSEEDKKKLIQALDKYIRRRLDRKGIIHSISYKWRSFLMKYSKHKDRMITHSGRTTADVVDAFKRMPEPGILVSPSIVQGYDFPGDTCRWQVIWKVPFPDSRSSVVKRRRKEDKEYTNNLAMQNLVQACGRIVRSERDWGETILFDSHLEWFFYYNRHLAPDWFSVKRRHIMPSGMILAT